MTLPRYSYTCTACGAVLDRTVAINDRDTQVCVESVVVESTQSGATEYKRCSAPLHREEISLTAKMAHQWAP